MRSALFCLLTVGLFSACSGGGTVVNSGESRASNADDKRTKKDVANDSDEDLEESKQEPSTDTGPRSPAQVVGDEEGFVTDESAEEAMDADPITEDSACAATELIPEVVEVEVPKEITITTEMLAPVAIYIVLDNSGSMDDDADGGEGTENSKWNQAAGAITDFVNDPTSDGINVGIQYFHPPDAGGNRENNPAECDGSAHSQPDVDVAVLPDNASAIVDSLAGTEPDGSTPTVGALTGGIGFCQARQEANPDEKCVVVLVTDGQPRGCGLDNECNGGGNDCVDPNAAATLTPIAADGLTTGVQTFTVGMDGVNDDGFNLLNAIAIAGGTDCTPDDAGAEACDVSASGSASLLEALTGIRDIVTVTETVTETMTVVETQTLECQWGIPEVPEGETFDPGLVNVTLSIAGAEAEPLGAVEDEDACENVESGWYFDDPDDPNQILACPQSCTAIEEAEEPVVQILLGCAPEPPRPAK